MDTLKKAAQDVLSTSWQRLALLIFVPAMLVALLIVRHQQWVRVQGAKPLHSGSGRIEIQDGWAAPGSKFDVFIVRIDMVQYAVFMKDGNMQVVLLGTYTGRARDETMDRIKQLRSESEGKE